MHLSSSHLTSRICALLLLGSVWVGVLAPGAVAMSRTDIQQAAGQEGLASDVQDFLNGVLEDAMLRAALVAPSQTSKTTVVRSLGDRAPLTIVSVGVLEATSQSVTMAHFVGDIVDVSSLLRVPIRSGPHQTRAP